MTSLAMPAVDTATVDRRAEIAAALAALVPNGVISEPTGLKPYESCLLYTSRCV